MSMPQRFNVRREDAKSSLIDLLARELQCSKKAAKKLLDARKVFVNNRRVWMAKHALKPGDRVEVQAFEQAEESPKLVILHEDSDFIVVAKPPGILSDGKKSVEILLRAEKREPEIRAVHRLDRDTSGCLLFARNEAARLRAIEEFEQQRVVKRYLAIAVGASRKPLGVVQIPLDGKSAKTAFSVLDANAQASLLEARLFTGRMHQIRRHLAAYGLSVAGDKQYGRPTLSVRNARSIGRQMLHAWKLEIPALALACTARVPEDMHDILSQLRLRLPKSTK